MAMGLDIPFCEAPLNLSMAPQGLEVVDAAAPAFWPAWNAFLDEYPRYTYRYKQPVLEYNRMLAGPAAIDRSFVVRRGERTLAVCPLLIDEVDGRRQASLSRIWLPAPLGFARLSEKQTRNLEEFVFDTAVERLKACGAVRWLVEAEVLSLGANRIEDTVFARRGALDVSGQCHIMDLTLPHEALWRQVRHSARSTINKGLRTYEFLVYDRTNYTFEVGERHRLLHHKCAGRVTRPIETFHKMYSWVEADCGLMFEQRQQGQVVQMIFVVLGKGTACGASAADDPDFRWPVPMTHAMNFFMYQETARRGIQYYEVGETTYRDSLYAVYTPKERTICDFKRGFGDRSYPLKRYVWFDSPEEEVRFLEERLARYKAHLCDSEGGEG
ncbi:MAG: hypothetical protein WBD75_10425 [Phycisphaerae bacterium]